MLLKTNAQLKDGRTYRRRLLSEYLPDVGLSKYIDYPALKTAINKATKAPTPADRDAAATQFFAQLKQSFIKVKQVLHDLECRAGAMEKQIRNGCAEDLRSGSETLLFETYALLTTIDRYRRLNVAGFAKAMEKFLTRVAISSLELQQRLFKADDIVSKSILSFPLFATGHAKEFVAATYSVTHSMTLEQSLNVLEHMINRNPNFTK